MTKRAIILASNGFEDIELICPLDVLTRLGVSVALVTSEQPAYAATLLGAYGSTLVPATSLSALQKLPEKEQLFDALIVPGGKRNAQTLAASQDAIALIRRHYENKKLIAAICASPSHVLAEAGGLLEGRKACGDPAFNDKLRACGAIVTNQTVTVDGSIITSVGPGSALQFALVIASRLGFESAAANLSRKWGVQI